MKLTPAEQKRIHANTTDGTSFILRRIGFRSRKLRDFICSLQGVAGARREFDCRHLQLARRLDHTGKDETAETFVTRCLNALEKEQRRTGRIIFRVERGGGIERKPTHYVDYITPAAVWIVRQAEGSELWKESHTRAMEMFVSDAVEMLPLVEEIEGEGMNPDSLIVPFEIRIKRNRRHSIGRACANFNLIAEANRGAEEIISEAQKIADEILERAHLVAQKISAMEAEGVQKCHPSGDEFHENTEEISNLQAALDYANWDDLPVFPVREDKAPYTANGFKDATRDPAMIRQFWRKWPEANIGIPTGEASGWLVIDIDPRHGGDVSLTALIEQYGDAWLQTRQARTGGGGHHLILAYPKGSNIRNSAGRLGEGIDVRAKCGYIVAPPSIHASGRSYQWLNDLKPAESPEWLLKLLTEERGASPSKVQPRARSGAKLGAVIPDGERNESLFKIGSSLRGKGAEYDEIEAELLRINLERCSPPLPDSEVLKIARSVSRLAANRVAVGA